MPFFTKFAPTRFSIHWWFLPELLLPMVTNANFTILWFLLCLLVAILPQRRAFPTPPFIHMYISMNLCIFILFNGLLTIIVIISLMLKLSQIWPLRTPSSCFLYHFDMTSSLLSDTSRCSRIILFFPCTSHFWNQSFL